MASVGKPRQRRKISRAAAKSCVTGGATAGKAPAQPTVMHDFVPAGRMPTLRSAIFHFHETERQ
ncbi:MAG: hypothetical protein LBT05_16510 [Planctomycetaceae bacterium]|nr:hypothetical protein [Planctomycetaceae bacterium]